MKTKTTLTILALCVICAATLMSGCMESDQGSIQELEYIPPTPEPISIPESIVTPTPEPEQIIISTIPDNYYDINYNKYFVKHKLYNYLKSYTWARARGGDAGWGIPEVTELEHELTEMGCNVTIRYAHVSTTIDHEDFKTRVKTDAYDRSGCLPEMDQYNAWLMIELDGEIVAYNAYGTYWAFKPESNMKDEYVSGGKWHDWWFYKENVTYTYNGNTWTMNYFHDFEDIYELEEWFISGDKLEWELKNCKNGAWCSYYNSPDYNATDDFLIQFGWWMTEEEFHETETRVNEATDWFVLVK